MADNLGYTEGVGASIASKDIGGNHHQIMLIRPSSLTGDGRKTVASSGTAEPLVAISTPCRRVIVTAETTNSSFVVIGASTVVADAATRQGVPLAPGQTIDLNVLDLADVYIDALVNGEGVTFLYEAVA